MPSANGARMHESRLAHSCIREEFVDGLCRVNANQAAYLLRRLRQKGKLSCHGIKRGAYYTLTEENMRKE